LVPYFRYLDRLIRNFEENGLQNTEMPVITGTPQGSFLASILQSWVWASTKMGEHRVESIRV